MFVRTLTLDADSSYGLGSHDPRVVGVVGNGSDEDLNYSLVSKSDVAIVGVMTPYGSTAPSR